jgi:hypothetical protein
VPNKHVAATDWSAGRFLCGVRQIREQGGLRYGKRAAPYITLRVLRMLSEKEVNYAIWQNRATRFYLSARLLHRHGLFAPAAAGEFRSPERVS